MTLEGKVFIVTGAANEIGAATVRLIEDRGGTAVAADVAGTGFRLDVTQPADWDAVIAATIAAHGHLDGLVCNTSVVSSGAIVDIDLKTFRDSARVHVEGNFTGIQKVVAQLRNQGTPARGSIVAVAPVVAARAVSGTAIHAATMAALSNMARAIGVELGRKGNFIRVNVVAPGEASSAPGISDYAEDVAQALVFLLSDDASFMTASVTVVDGGQSLA